MGFFKFAWIIIAHKILHEPFMHMFRAAWIIHPQELAPHEHFIHRSRTAWTFIHRAHAVWTFHLTARLSHVSFKHMESAAWSVRVCEICSMIYSYAWDLTRSHINHLYYRLIDDSKSKIIFLGPPHYPWSHHRTILIMWRWHIISYHIWKTWIQHV